MGRRTRFLLSTPFSLVWLFSLSSHTPITLSSSKKQIFFVFLFFLRPEPQPKRGKGRSRRAHATRPAKGAKNARRERVKTGGGTCCLEESKKSFCFRSKEITLLLLHPQTRRGSRPRGLSCLFLSPLSPKRTKTQAIRGWGTSESLKFSEELFFFSVTKFFFFFFSSIFFSRAAKTSQQPAAAGKSAALVS